MDPVGLAAPPSRPWTSPPRSSARWLAWGCALALHLLSLPCSAAAQRAPSQQLPSQQRPSQHPPSQALPSNEEFELMLRYIVEDVGVPGIVLGALDADGRTRIVSYGSGGPDAPPPGPRSLFEIGSVTKTFTGTLLADMVARGEVALHDPVSTYLPDEVTVPSRGGRQITLLNLATHRSGLPRSERPPRTPDREDVEIDQGVEAMYAFLSAHELRREPGARYEYSNLGFGLLGHALARAAGRSLPDLVRERILDPLGMDRTGYVPTSEMAARMTPSSAPDDAASPNADARRGAGGLVSNAEDMLTYLAANVGRPETDLERAMRMAHRARMPTSDGGAEIGLAWRTHTVGERSIVSHSGRRGGHRAFVGFDPERRIGVVVLANSVAFTDIGDFGTSILMTPRPPPEWNADVDPARHREYAGEYRGDAGGSVHVRWEDEGWLTYQPSGNARTRLYPRSDSSFYMLRGPWTLTFRRDGAGEALEMHMAVDERAPAARGLERTVDKVGDESPPPRAVAAGNAWSSFTFPWRPVLGIVGGVVLALALLAIAGRLRNKLT